MLKDLVIKNRSYRKFHFDKKVSVEALRQLVDLARLTPSSKNRQPLKYVLVTEDPDANFVFKHLKWAWFLKDWSGPTPQEQPPAYIILALDKTINEQADIDAGIVSQTILLGATEMDMGGCIIRTVNRYELKKYFQLPESHEIILVIAIGFPNQDVRISEVNEDSNTQYFEEEGGRHVVPKRSLDELIILPASKI
ncbi:MAG: nitroreductase family protein [Bacteroidales bacterium]|nr:nitroreductase family protein [Bacteroidales bacterium]